MSSGGLPHIPNKLIHSASPGKAPCTSSKKTPHMTGGLYYITLITFLRKNEVATVAEPGNVQCIQILAPPAVTLSVL